MEGDEDDIRATFYILAFQREFNDDEAELRWKVVDMMVVGGETRFILYFSSPCRKDSFCWLWIESKLESVTHPKKNVRVEND